MHSSVLNLLDLVMDLRCMLLQFVIRLFECFDIPLSGSTVLGRLSNLRSFSLMVKSLVKRKKNGQNSET